ncbi:MAG: hypothetical protein IID08_07825 [Candidatus Hydrogenedentes bacterium]|nr:hypothetical protein [Candidatus Hydrogenedentota bacterium]
MANFSTEADVRETFQLTDTVLVPSALVVRSIDDAHSEILRFLDPQYDVSPAAAGVILGETLLAGAHLLRSLASKDAFSQKHLAVGGVRVQAGNRFQVLTKLASDNEGRAWEALEPFLLVRPSRKLAEVTDSVPVVGEE